MAQETVTLRTDFTSGSVTKQLVSFATPLFFSNLLQVLYNMVDMIVVGTFIGGAGLSAVAIGGDIVNFLTFVAIGFSTAGQVIISQYIGAKQNEKINTMIGTMFTLLLSSAFLLSIICIKFTDQLLRLMNTPAEAWNLAESYMATTFTGLTFIFGYNLISAVLRGMGDSKRPFMFIAIAAVLNLILDLIFIAGFRMSTFGVALATVIAQSVSFTFALIYLFRRKEQFGFDFKPKSFVLNMNALKPLLLLGFPMALKSAAVHSSKLFVNSWINSYGVAVSAVAAIGNKIGMISNQFANAFTSAGSSMIGQNIGAEKYERVPKVIGTSFAINFLISAVLISLIVLFPSEIFQIFSKDPDVLTIAFEYVPIAVLSFTATAFRAPMSAFINGTGNYKLNFAVAILDAVLARVGLALLLGLGFKMGYAGFWYGGELASFVPFLIGAVYYMTGSWRKKRFA